MTTKLTFLKPVTAITLILGLAAGTALAQGGGALKFDTDGDQQISITEFLAGADAKFADADTNADGFLSDDERIAKREARRADYQNKRFEKADLNGDGQISKDELNQASQNRHSEKQARFDINGDGTVDAAEKEQRRAEYEARKAEYKAQKGERTAGGADQRFNPDTNDDGFISQDEHSAAAQKMFSFLDANGDGVLTEGEGKRRGKRGHKKGKRKGFGS